MAEQPLLRWSPRYVASEEWRSQLEASLINLKVTQPKTYFRVLAELKPDWLALVDRDEWSPDQIAAQQAVNSSLFVLPRFCLESYLVDPAELCLALPPVQQLKISGGVTAIEPELFANLAAWQPGSAMQHFGK